MTAGRAAPRIWSAAVILNAALGLLTVWPLRIVLLFVEQYPLAAMGITRRDPTDNDGIEPWLVLLVLVLGVAVLVWLGANTATRRVCGASGRWPWIPCVVLTLAVAGAVLGTTLP